MAISIELVKELRERTGAGITDCKSALESTGGDIEKAIDELRKKGIAKMEKRADRVTNAGTIATYNHGGQILGVCVLACETDFVAKSDTFKELAYNIAMQVAAQNPMYINSSDVESEILEREKSIFMEELMKSGKPSEIIEKIAEGKLQKYFEENCLMEQIFFKDETKKIKDLINELVSKMGEKTVVTKIARITL